MMKIRASSAVWIGILLCVTPGCDFRVGVRTLEWPGVKARQEKRTDDPKTIREFYQVYVYFSGLQEIVRVRLPDGSIVTTDELTRDLLKQRLGNSLRILRGKGWNALVVDYDIGHVTFYLGGDGAINGLRFNAVAAQRKAHDELKEKALPAIGVVGKEDVFELPLTHKQLETLFGKPKRDESRFFNT